VPTTLLPPFMVKFGASNIITSLYGEFWCQQHALCPTKQVKHEQFNVYMPFIQSYFKTYTCISEKYKSYHFDFNFRLYDFVCQKWFIRIAELPQNSTSRIMIVYSYLCSLLSVCWCNWNKEKGMR